MKLNKHNIVNVSFKSDKNVIRFIMVSFVKQLTWVIQGTLKSMKNLSVSHNSALVLSMKLKFISENDTCTLYMPFFETVRVRQPSLTLLSNGYSLYSLVYKCEVMIKASKMFSLNPWYNFSSFSPKYISIWQKMIYQNLQTNLHLPYVPKKITIGLSAWITFKVVSESKYNFM